MKYLYLLFLLGIFISSYSQEDPLYAQYINNPIVINPAYTGLTNNLNASASYRKQWAGFEGNPTTINANVHMSLSDNKMGLGVLFVQDKVGANKNTEAYATYAYRLDLGSSYLSFGLQAGFINFGSNDGLNPYDPSDPAFNLNNVIEPSMGAGIILNNERYFIGLSVPRMLNATTKLSDSGPDQFETVLYDQHYYASMAYIFFLSERVRLKPSVLLKAVQGAPLSIDYNASFTIDEKYTAGVFLRNQNAFGTLLQLRFAEAYRIAYALEVPFENSVGTQFTTHEITIGLSTAILGFHKTAISNF